MGIDHRDGCTVFYRIQFKILAAMQRRVVEMSVAIAALLVSLAVATAWLATRGHFEETRQKLAQLERVPHHSPSVSVPTRARLPAFNSAALAERVNRTATDIGLHPDEISYVLEAPPGQPYQRYRLTFPVKSNYLTIRRFIAALGTEMPNVALDGIRCSRASTSSPILACDLTFSAFFEAALND